MTFVATPQPTNVPPRVRLDIDSDDPGAAFTSLTVKRDGALIREQPFVGGPEALAFDYEAPFGVPVTYTAEGSFIPTATPDWTETWASLASWTGSGFAAISGVAASSTLGAAIVRPASGTIQKVAVTSPDYVRVELLTAGDVAVCSVAVTTNVVLTGTSAASVSGTGSFVLSLASGTVTAQAADLSWTVSRPYTGTPTKVRVVSLYPTVVPGITWSTTGTPQAIWGDTSGNIFVTDGTNSLVRKFNSSGTQTASWTTTGLGSGIWGDTSGNIFVTDITNSLVRKFNSSGTQTASWTTTGKARDIWVDTSGNVFVTDYINSLVRKFNSSGTQTASWTTTGQPHGIWGDTSGNIFVTDVTNDLVRKFNSSGTQTASWTTTDSAPGIWGDTSGNIYTSDENTTVRKFNSSGTQTASWTSPYGVSLWGDSTATSFFTADSTNSRVRKYVGKVASTDDIATTLVTSEQSFFATATTQLDVDEAWLIHPSQPSLSVSIDPGANNWRDDGINVDLGTKPVLSRKSTATRFNNVGRSKAVLKTHGNRMDGEWTLVLFTPRLDDRDAVQAIITDETPLLFRAPQGWDWDLPDGWYGIGDVDETRSFQGAGLQNPYRNITLPLTPVDEPIVRLGALWTWGDVLLTYDTWQDVLDNYDTWLDLLAGPTS